MAHDQITQKSHSAGILCEYIYVHARSMVVLETHCQNQLHQA